MRDKKKVAKMFVILSFLGWVGIDQIFMYFRAFKVGREAVNQLFLHSSNITSCKQYCYY